MATDDDSGLLRGPRADPKASPDLGGRTAVICKFHAYTGDVPCPYCYEAKGVADGAAIHRNFRPSGVPWVDSCPYCCSKDLRNYEPNKLHVTGYIWCGSCGAKDQMIPEEAPPQ